MNMLKKTVSVCLCAATLCTAAFAAGAGPGTATPLDGPDVPVLQVVIANTKRAAWRDSARGLGAADLAMHIVLPELDGRVLAGAIAFKEALPAQGGLAFAALANRPEPDRIALFNFPYLPGRMRNQRAIDRSLLPSPMEKLTS